LRLGGGLLFPTRDAAPQLERAHMYVARLRIERHVPQSDGKRDGKRAQRAPRVDCCSVRLHGGLIHGESSSKEERHDAARTSYMAGAASNDHAIAMLAQGERVKVFVGGLGAPRRLET